MTTGFRASDRQIQGGNQPAADGAIELGEVIEVDGSHYQVQPTTLVHVRLLRGDPDDRPRLLCRISQPLNFIPTPGTAVVVAVPAGFGYSPGAPMIIGCAGAAPGNQFAEDKAKMDFGPDYDLVIKARTITFTDYEDRYLTIGPQYGIKAGDADASGFQMKDGKWLIYASENGDAKATLQLAGAAGAKLLHKSPTSSSGFEYKDGQWVSYGVKAELQFMIGKLGKNAAPPGISYGASTASLASLNWFVETGPSP